MRSPCRIDTVCAKPKNRSILIIKESKNEVTLMSSTDVSFGDAELTATLHGLIQHVTIARERAGIPDGANIELGLARELPDGRISQAIDRYRGELQRVCHATSLAWPREAWRTTLKYQGEELIIALRPA